MVRATASSPSEKVSPQNTHIVAEILTKKVQQIPTLNESDNERNDEIQQQASDLITTKLFQQQTADSI